MNPMPNIKNSVEIYQWLLVLVVILLILLPIYMRVGEHYPFYISNIISISVFMTFARILFLLKYAPYARHKWFRLIMIFLPIPLLLYHIDTFFAFREFIEEEGVIKFFPGSSDMSDYHFGKFVKNQYMFFLISAIVTLLLMPIRMIISFWRTTNTKDRV